MTDPPAPRPPAPAPDRASAPGSGTRARPVLAAVLVLVLAVVGAACSHEDPFDRDAAVTRVVDASGGVVERPQAECYVDRVRDEVGVGPLLEGAEPQPEQLRQLTSIKIDCFGLDKIGATTSVSTGPPSSVDGVIPQPRTRGDDPALDALWDQCAAGSGAACDQLFDQAPVGSEYEEFAGTCGRRTQELHCADVYTTTTTAPVPTTAPPPTAPTTLAPGPTSAR